MDMESTATNQVNLAQMAGRTAFGKGGGGETGAGVVFATVSISVASCGAAWAVMFGDVVGMAHTPAAWWIGVSAALAVAGAAVGGRVMAMLALGMTAAVVGMFWLIVPLAIGLELDRSRAQLNMPADWAPLSAVRHSAVAEDADLGDGQQKVDHGPVMHQ